MLARAIASAVGRFYSDAMHAECIATLREAYAEPCAPTQSPAASAREASNPSDPSRASG